MHPRHEKQMISNLITVCGYLVEQSGKIVNFSRQLNNKMMNTYLKPNHLFLSQNIRRVALGKHTNKHDRPVRQYRINFVTMMSLKN